MPKVEIDGQAYWRDDGHEEFIAVDNPYDRISFKDLIWNQLIKKSEIL